MIRALVFDFDGTIIDSETPVYESWCAAYAEHGHTMPRERYLELIGTANHTFDPHGHLEQLCGYPIDRATLDATRMGRHRAVIASAGALPGVLDWIEEAVQRKLGLAVASSSQMWWVESNLERLGLRGHFPVVRGRETVRATKPAPDLFLGAVADLGVAPHEAIAIEDSAHGVAAAKAAGLYTIAVPNPMTAGLDFFAADLVVESLDAARLADVLQSVTRSRPRSGKARR